MINNKMKQILDLLMKQTEHNNKMIETLQKSFDEMQKVIDSRKNKEYDNNNQNHLHKKQIINNETIGQTAEQAIADVYNINSNISASRISEEYLERIKPLIEEFRLKNPNLVFEEALGSNNKDIDFRCNNDQTLSLKTIKKNVGKICPQNIGQLSSLSWDQKYMINLENKGDVKLNSKRYSYIKDNIEIYLNNMLDNLFCCDMLMIITNCEKSPELQLLKKKINNNFFIGKKQFISYSRPEYNPTWNQKKERHNGFSTTIRLTHNNKIFSIGELQFHNSGRNDIKFRFNLTFLKEMYRFL